MKKTPLGWRCSHARETCPKLLKFLFVLRSACQRHWCSSARNKMIPHSMQGIILGSKACLLHDCPLLSLERLFLRNSELPESCQTLYTVFSANVLHSMQRIILDSKACILHECPLLSSEKLFLHNLDIPKKHMPNFIRYFLWILQPAASSQLAQASYLQTSYPQMSYPQLGRGTCPHAHASSSKGTAKPKT